MAEAPALAGALDQAGDVGDDELGGVVEAHDAEVRLERRERVVGDLRLGRRDHADQRALADVREPDERDVGHQLHLELEPALLAVLALLGEARRPALVGQELGVAAPAAPAGRGQPAVAVVQQLGEHLAAVQVLDDRALGHRDLERPRRAGRGGPCPCRARRCSARRWGWSRNASSDATLWSATSQMSPPLPPSPPFGPPNATGPSRRNDTQPAPPSPPRTLSWHSSTNWEATLRA